MALWWPGCGESWRAGTSGARRATTPTVQAASRYSIVVVLSSLGVAACFDPTEVPSEGGSTAGTTGPTDPTDTTGGPSDPADDSGTGGATEPDTGVDDTTGGPQPDDAAVVSGERLRRRDLVADGGARVFVGLHDAALDLDCRFEWAEDGVLRCLPPFQLNVAYADSGCTEPVHPVMDGCSFDWVYERTHDYACGEHSLYTTYRIDHDGPATSGTYWYQTASGCIEAGMADELLPVEVVPPETFVGGVYDDVTREGGIVARFIAADDGARAIAELRDEARDAVCAIGPAEERCRLQRVAGTSPAQTAGATYADAACDVLVGTWLSDDPCPPDATVTWSGGCGGATNSYFEVGREHDGAAVTQWTGETCEPIGPYGRIFAVGAPIPEDSMPPVERASEGTGRLTAWSDVSTAGEALGPGRAFHDTETDADCRPTRFTDDTTRCVPEDATLFSDFEIPTWSDPGCTGDRLILPFSCAGADAPVLEVAFVYCEGETVLQAYALGEPFTGTTAYADYGDGCMPIDVAPGEWHRLGATLPATTFAALENVVE